MSTISYLVVWRKRKSGQTDPTISTQTTPIDITVDAVIPPGKEDEPNREAKERFTKLTEKFELTLGIEAKEYIIVSTCRL